MPSVSKARVQILRAMEDIHHWRAQKERNSSLVLSESKADRMTWSLCVKAGVRMAVSQTENVTTLKGRGRRKGAL